MPGKQRCPLWAPSSAVARSISVEVARARASKRQIERQPEQPAERVEPESKEHDCGDPAAIDQGARPMGARNGDQGDTRSECKRSDQVDRVCAKEVVGLAAIHAEPAARTVGHGPDPARSEPSGAAVGTAHASGAYEGHEDTQARTPCSICRAYSSASK